MNWRLLEFLEPLAAPGGPMSRLRSIGRTFGGSKGGPSSLWLVLLLGALGIAGLLTVFAWWQTREQRKERWRRFRERADRVGLGDDERTLLQNIAIGAAAGDPDVIFSSRETFERGLAALDQETAPGKPRAGLCRSCRYHQSLQRKLGFAATPAKGEAVHLGPLRVDATVTVLRQATAEEFEAAVTGAEDAGGQLTLTLESAQDQQCEPGEAWVVRYPEESILWEFDTVVLRSVGAQRFFLRPISDAHRVERRRFVRVPVDRTARVAPFPYETDQAVASPPQFVPARLVQMAGPGVLLKADVDANVDDRVLVVLELNDKCVEGVGVVRREKDPQSDDPTVAVELLGLNTAQVADLARETNLSAIQAAATHDQELEAVAAQPAEET